MRKVALYTSGTIFAAGALGHAVGLGAGLKVVIAAQRS
jgi:hypothetical protein